MVDVALTLCWDEFINQVQHPDKSGELKHASLTEDLAAWTKLMTDVVVLACNALGWEAAARRHRSSRLPEPASEYLSLDAMAFPTKESTTATWPLPLAVFVLENSPRDETVGYSLWKVLFVRAPLRLVFAYRRDWDQTRGLVDYLSRVVIGSLSPAERVSICGYIALITGSRGESEIFPHGYFKLWNLDANLGKFERN
jgi:hypothetical protein